jgi:hypothetical protein
VTQTSACYSGAPPAPRNESQLYLSATTSSLFITPSPAAPLAPSTLPSHPPQANQINQLGITNPAITKALSLQRSCFVPAVGSRSLAPSLYYKYLDSIPRSFLFFSQTTFNSQLVRKFATPHSARSCLSPHISIVNCQFLTSRFSTRTSPTRTHRQNVSRQGEQEIPHY